MLDQLNAKERALVSSFRAHPLISSLTTLPWDDLLTILIQRRFLSLSIINIYEHAIDALQDHSIKDTVRRILHEEYPRNSRGQPLASHRELLFRDLQHLGASREQILLTSESTATEKIRRQSMEQMTLCLGLVHSDLALISFLRFWAEVLVSVEYECLWPRLSEKIGQESAEKKPRSEFYYYHMIHDRRQCDIGQEHILGGLTHAQELARHIASLISDEIGLRCAIEQAELAWQLKNEFYNQFITKPCRAETCRSSSP